MVIDCKNISDRKELHKLIAEGLNFPDYYGNNLDALYDCLLEIKSEVIIELDLFEILKQKLSIYAEKFVNTISEASEKNENIKLIINWTFSRKNNLAAFFFTYIILNSIIFIKSGGCCYDSRNKKKIYQFDS